MVNDLLSNIAFFMSSYIRMVFYECCYTNERPPGVPDSGFTFRRLNRSDMNSLKQTLALQGVSGERYFRSVTISDFEQRLQKGEICYIGERNGDIAGYCWFARSRFYIRELDYSLDLEPADLYLHNAYVLKKYRRHNITTGIINAARLDLAPAGFNRDIIAVMHWNRPSRQFALKMGFKEMGSLSVGYLCTFRYAINNCMGLKLSCATGIFDFYRRLFARLGRHRTGRGRMEGFL